MSAIVFLGGGRITSAMLAGLRLGKTRHHLVVHDRNPGKLRDLKRCYAVDIEPDLTNAVRQADMLIVAVRPNSVREILRIVENRRLLAVSLAAGVPLRVLSKVSGANLRWARAMPSPVCRTRHGLTALSFSRTLSQADRKRVRDFFAAFGHVVEIPEGQFDAFTVTYTCSHGLHALATLARAAEESGLDEKTALLASAHALADGIIAWREGRHSVEALMAEAATPGGIAEVTVSAMDSAGFGRAVRKGVAAGLRRAGANAGK
jgi:pyrroline-5-carboxylate reductase